MCNNCLFIDKKKSQRKNGKNCINSNEDIQHTETLDNNDDETLDMQN